MCCPDDSPVSFQGIAVRGMKKLELNEKNLLVVLNIFTIDDIKWTQDDLSTQKGAQYGIIRSI